MSGNEEPLGDDDAALLEAGDHPMTPTEAGVPSLAEVIAQTEGTHRRVAIAVGGTENFPESPEGHPDDQD